VSAAGAWAVVPAAGRGARFGGEVPKQYLELDGQPLLFHAIDALLSHPGVTGVVVALAAGDERWPGWSTRMGKPVLSCTGGSERAHSVLAALDALSGAGVDDDTLVLVHDAARPNLDTRDIGTLLEVAASSGDGAILAAPVRDTLKRAGAGDRIASTEPREHLWRALTPQAFRLGALAQALRQAEASGLAVTDEAMAMEHVGAHPRLVEGREDNIKVTTPADFALAAHLLTRRKGAGSTTEYP